MVPFLLPCATTGLASIATWGGSGTTPRGSAVVTCLNAVVRTRRAERAVQGDVIPTTTFLQTCFVEPRVVGTSKTTCACRLRPQSRDFAHANLVNPLKCRCRVMSVWQVLHGTPRAPLISAQRVAQFDDHCTSNLFINNKLRQRYSRYMVRQRYATRMSLIFRAESCVTALTPYATSQSDVSRHLPDGGLTC
jgi:hypothetical protein